MCCRVYCHPEYDMWKWNSVIRSQHINVAPFFNVVLCLQKLQEVEGKIPVKNNVQALYRSIRSVNLGCRIFVSNLPPNPHGGSPVLKRRAAQFNTELRETVNELSLQMPKLHYLSMYEHWTDSEDGSVLSPVQKYYSGEGTFTKLGCLMFREFMFREMGVKTYWF